MKKCAFLLFLFSSVVLAKGTLNIYTWDGYFPPAVIKQFSKKYHVTVQISYFDNNEVLYTKLKTDPHLGYDIIVPSSYYVERMAKEGMLKKLDMAHVPTLRNIQPSLLHPNYDPHNWYSIPYVWGGTGIVVDDRYWNPKRIHAWKDLWQPRFKNQLLILDDYREAFGMALISLGYSSNDRNPTHIKKAYAALKKLMPNIKLFNSNSVTNLFADQDATAGIGWNGDVYLALADNPHLHFIYPKSGYSAWVDCVSVPRYAPDMRNVYLFLSYINRAKVAAQIAQYIGYATPNKAAMAYLPKAMRHSQMLYPSKAVIKRGQVQQDIGSAREIYLHYWQQLKLGA